MRFSRQSALLILAGAAGALSATVAAQPIRPVIVVQPGKQSCPISQTDLHWIGNSFQAWQFTATEKLRLSDARNPKVVFFDEHCTYTIPADQGPDLHAHAAPHDGEVGLPSGEVIPASVASFAAPGKDDDPGFFVMSLPSIWTAQGVTSGLGVDVLATGVMLHELMHTWQFPYANPTLEALGKRYGLPDDISDNSLQDAFKDDTRYVAAYRNETDLLYRAAAAASDAEARRLAFEALKSMRQRRARFFTGTNEKWVPLDEIFLTMEGLGQWTMYAWLTDSRGRGLEPALAQREARRGNKHWSQEEGLGLFLVIDRLVPDWQKLAFADTPETAEALLARAAGPE